MVQLSDKVLPTIIVEIFSVPLLLVLFTSLTVKLVVRFCLSNQVVFCEVLFKPTLRLCVVSQ